MRLSKTLLSFHQSYATLKKMQDKPIINYKQLRKISPEAARTAVLNYLFSNSHNVTQTARTFGLQRMVVYDIIKKSKKGNLQDRSKAPKVVQNRTSQHIIEKIIEAKNKTGFGPKRLFDYLQLRYGLYVAYGTIRSILRRNEHRILD